MAGLLVDLSPIREYPQFRRLWLGQSLASIGSQITVAAIALNVYELTKETFAVGILGLCVLVPLVVLGLYGGALVDTHDRRKVAIASSLLMWIATLGIVAQAFLKVEQVWLLYLLTVIQTCGSAVNSPARNAIIPRLVPARVLPQANALNSTTFSLGMFVGPLIGAALVGLVGFGPTYVIDAVTFTAALWALFRLPPMPPLPDSGMATGQDSASRSSRGWRSVADGLRYLRSCPNVRMTFIIDLAAMVLAQPRVLFPAVGAAIIGGGTMTTGVLTASVAAGALLGGILSGPLARVRYQGRAIAWSVATWGGCISAFGLVLLTAGHGRPSGVIWWALIVSFVVLAIGGGVDMVSSVFRSTILQTATPDYLRGRLQGVFIVVVAGGPRLGELFTGTNATWAGEAWAAIIGGGLCVTAVLGLMRWNRGFLSYDAKHPVA